MTNLNTLPPPCVNLVSTIVVLRISSVLSNYQLVRCWDMTTTENQVNQNILQIGNRRNYNFWWFKHFLHLQGCTEKFKGGEPEGECLRGSAEYWEKYTLFVKFLTKCTKRVGGAKDYYPLPLNLPNMRHNYFLFFPQYVHLNLNWWWYIYGIWNWF